MVTADAQPGRRGPDADDVAVIGYSFKLPQAVDDDSSFWEVLEARRNLMTSWPENRIEAESFANDEYHKVSHRIDATRQKPKLIIWW